MIRTLANRYFSKVTEVFGRIKFFQLLPGLVLVSSLFVTYQLWRVSQSEAEVALQTEFNFRAADVRHKIEQHMLIYEHMLNGVQGFFAASQYIDRSEFHAYVNELNLDKNYPGIQSLGLILYLPRTKINQHVAAVRKEGFPKYTIWPAGKRDIYTSVVYIEPFSGRNLKAFGYDPYADSVRRLAMERARDTGLSHNSGMIRLVQETDERTQAGFVMWLPMYRNHTMHNTVAERQANLYGWLGAAFRMDDLMQSLFSQDDNKLDIEIYDGDKISDQYLMHDAYGNSHGKAPVETHFKEISRLEIAGHNWTLLVSSLPGFDEGVNRQKSRFIVYAGIMMSILIAAISWILVHSHTRALQTAQALDRELNERKRAEAGNRLAATVFDTVDTAVMVTDQWNHIVKVNPAFTEITGYSAEEAMGNKSNMLSSGAHPPEFYKAMWGELKSRGSWEGEISNRRKNGEYYIEWLSINEVRDNEGILTNYVALFSDISERKAEEAHMHNLAHYDALTGLPNRILLTDRLQQAISSARREKSHMALMFIDLDKFKPVNDTLGHHIGDLMLMEVARRMLECLRESDSAARVGGDEFVVLLPVIEAESDAIAVAEKIRNTLSRPFELSGHNLNISASIGVAVYPEHGNDENILLKNADAAMYFAKEAGHNNVMLFESRMKKGV